MPAISLPSHYYLNHGLEIFNYLERHCAHLLPCEARHYIAAFRRLHHDEQCLLIRIWSRKPRFLKKTSLIYPEIAKPRECLVTLLEQGFINQVDFLRAGDDLFTTLTKPNLLELLNELGAQPISSTPKTSLVGMCETWRAEHQGTAVHPLILDHYVERAQQDIIDYLLFLYFGDLRNHFERFILRDLGLAKRQPAKNSAVPPSESLRRQPEAKQSARFMDINEAQHEFLCHKHLRDLKRSHANRASTDELLAFLTANSADNSTNRDRLILALGEHLLPTQPDTAVQVWQLSEHADVLEKRIRWQYQAGQKDRVKAELEQLQTQDLSAASEVFVADFYARKFSGKRTSIYTDMLHNAADSIGLDELYLSTAEQGVINYYRRQGIHAQFVENKVWRAFFALLFWDLLFEQEGGQANEFDRLPLALQRGNFYRRFAQPINAKLTHLAEPAQMQKYLIRTAVNKHGRYNGLFRWSEDLLATLLLIVRHAPMGAIAAVMTRMAKDFKNSKDGYPDLLVLDKRHLRFEEVKAPGDVLRPNQLVSINRLSRAGFSVLIRPVHWTIDPEQIYAVVDIETTGGRQNGNSITEIAVVKVSNQKVISEWSTLVKPNQPIPKHISHLTGISNAMVEDAPIFAEIAESLNDQLAGCVFVAHNVSFDYGFIKAAYQALERSFTMPKLCTVRGARKAFPGLPSYSLGKLVQHFDIDLKNHHRALDDARATAHLLSLIQAQNANSFCDTKPV